MPSFLPALLALALVPMTTAPATTTTTAAASASQVSYADPLYLSGQVTSTAADGGRPVHLHRLHSDDSRVALAGARTDSSGRFRFRLSTAVAGTHRYLVRAPATSTASADDSPVVTVQVTRDPTRLGISWSGLAGPLGGRAVATGRVRGTTHANRVVRVLMWLPGGWRELARTRTDAEGDYRLVLRNSWLRNRVVVVEVTVTPGMKATRGGTGRSHVWPFWRPLGQAGMHRLMATRPGNYRLNPCRVHGWRLNDASGTHLRDATEGVRRLSQATGIAFRYLGRTSHDPAVSEGWPGPVNGIPTTLVIGFGPNAGTRWWVGSGEASPVALRYSKAPDGSPVTQIVAAGLWINTDQVRDHGFAAGSYAGHVLLHELGHTVGLLHPSSDSARTQRMSSANRDHAARWGAGDLAGLSAVGLQMGCVREWPGMQTTWVQ